MTGPRHGFKDRGREASLILQRRAYTLRWSDHKGWHRHGEAAVLFPLTLALSYECAQANNARESGFRYGGGIARYEDEIRVNRDMYRLCMGSKGYSRVEGGQWVGPRD